MRRQALPLLAAVLVATGMLALSALPTETKHALHIQGPLHPWLHLLGFAVLNFLLLCVTRSASLRAVVFAALLLFGYATEARESRKDGWPVEQRDVVLDAAGVLLGALLFAGLRWRAQPRSG